MNIFLFNKSLRCNDNTTLIYQLKQVNSVTPIFIFTEQVNKNKNDYFSNNSCGFMCESLHELSNTIKNEYQGELYFFHNDNLINCLKEIHQTIPIKTLGTNFDYSTYAVKRQTLLNNFCTSNNITFYIKEDHVLYPILEGETNKNDGAPYTVFTPFKNHCMKSLKVIKPNNFNNYIFNKQIKLKKVKSFIKESDIDNFYEYNINANVRGGRNNGLAILQNIKEFQDYSEKRDCLTYNTTFLSAHNHFGTISIREVYWIIKNKLKTKSIGLINELHWRDFYYNLFYNFPHMIGGMIGKTNMAFKAKYDNIKWDYNHELFTKWCNGTLGIPCCDAAMIQLNITGYQHNRMRMLTACVATKLLLLPWFWCEKYFAKNLIDYDVIQNGGGWGWTVTGIDPTQLFRIFSPKQQSLKFDPNCEYIKKYLPELKNLNPNEIHDWENTYQQNLDNGIKYYAPAINYKHNRNNALKEFSRINKN
jgi:deoxyribodipyrimidine photo-lyase